MVLRGLEWLMAGFPGFSHAGGMNDLRWRYPDLFVLNDLQGRRRRRPADRSGGGDQGELSALVDRLDPGLGRPILRPPGEQRDGRGSRLPDPVDQISRSRLPAVREWPTPDPRFLRQAQHAASTESLKSRDRPIMTAIRCLTDHHRSMRSRRLRLTKLLTKMPAPMRIDAP